MQRALDVSNTLKYCYADYSCYSDLVDESCILIDLKFVLVLKHAII